MGQASASAASTSAINSLGGNITNSAGPDLKTILILAGVLLLALVLWKRL